MFRTFKVVAFKRHDVQLAHRFPVYLTHQVAYLPLPGRPGGAEEPRLVDKSFEAGTQTGMMGLFGNTANLQTFIEKTAVGSNVAYIALVDQEGTILAHNDRQLIGTALQAFTSDGFSSSAVEPGWRTVDNGSRQKIFEGYKSFLPETQGEGHHGKSSGHKGMPMDSGMRQTMASCSPGWVNGMPRERLLDPENRPFIVVGRDDRIGYSNEVAHTLLGIETASTEKAPAMAVLPDALCEMRDEIGRQKKVVTRELQLPGRTGSEIPVNVSAAEIIGEDGGQIGSMFILQDLSELRRLEKKVRQREKLAAVGDLAAGIAHEVRNPLSSIKGYVTYFGSLFD